MPVTKKFGKEYGRREASRSRESVSDTLSDIQERAERGRRRTAFFAAWGAVALMAIGALWVAVHSPVFAVQAVEIQGVRRVTEQEVLALLEAAVPGDSFVRRVLGFRNMLVWPDRLPEDTLALNPYLRDLAIHKSYSSHAVRVDILERTPFGLWCFKQQEPGECFWFDDQGVVFERSLAAEGNLIRVVNDYSQNAAPLAGVILPRAFMQNFFSILRVLAAADLNIKEVRLDDVGREEMRVVTHDGPELYFSLRFPSDDALPVIASLYAGGFGEGFSKLEYLDFRVENRAYYK
ncbi:MAG: hypothetical protein A3A43_02300 [Candidatus Liptonbacteria bacterium RIFCSPLOWO2_01_FULL_56_20]|uniref:POTRA domain-containing protein n=1 Tax=Candidatus Liptonbacteria bacterium RIFCSPLOWO2_01_FULL_56_20 TaxID=1798652 RepID=A0A1G2CJC6_9BACT|nr:MAG: hypothetical protein A2681_01630 [Candidatus Liptonbacteria bacterium RIFCSPHIGHO2_01_FULL_56_18b]OGZ01312.1 MAG: hypothetical protein A3A43_02300 [Candidatus Liptonbacteria bacterium RIFCSPLOWO2_01_FULL_56_20]